MHKSHIPTGTPSQSAEKTPQQDEQHTEGYYHSLATSAKEAGDVELAERLTNYALGISQDPDRVSWDERRHISPNSEYYEKDRTKVREEIDDLTGYRSLDRYIVDWVTSQPPDRRVQSVIECSEDIEKARADWLDLIGDESIRARVRYAIADELVKQGCITWPEDFDWQSQQCVADLNEKCTLTIKGLSTSEFYDFIEKHTNDYGEEARKMEGRFVEYNREFRQKLNEFISNRTIPMSSNKARKRSLQFKICPLDQVTKQASEIVGIYHPDTTNVYIVSGYDPEDERTTYFHERLHAISGSTVLFNPKDGGSFEIQKAGLGIAQYPEKKHPEKETGTRFSWLDEAVTTELANKMSGHDYEVYPEERKIKNLLLHGGKKNIPDKLLIDAYFEDFEPEDGEKIPAWKKFHDAITEKYGPRFLVRLDKIIQEDGNAAGVEFIKLRQKRSVMSALASLAKARWGERRAR